MIAAALVCAFAAVVGTSAEDPAPVKKRVLVYTVSAGYEHEVAHRETANELSLVERALVDLGRKRGSFEAVPSRDASDFTREKLASFDLVFFYTTGELPISEEGRAALFDFVQQGKAFAGAHCATDTFYKVPQYGEMIGAYFDGHPWHESVRVKVEDAAHPATAHLDNVFDITDEIYQFKTPYDRTKLHVLLSLDADKLDLARDGVHRMDRDFAIAWCREYGKGRVFYTALGHRPEVWADERFLKHVEGGFAWAMRTATAAPPPPQKPSPR
jgi:type 1 glutamine amidotransferase